ncbi:hypothetical protein ACQEV4_37995 [Streptomyces shenzhenensis]|uniref:hypothetical protein n=1 Tax=Streptomyces shenzhenensis TaxID=943815 RepID=UPI003D909F34
MVRHGRQTVEDESGQLGAAPPEVLLDVPLSAGEGLLDVVVHFPVPFLGALPEQRRHAQPDGRGVLAEQGRHGDAEADGDRPAAGRSGQGERRRPQEQRVTDDHGRREPAGQQGPQRLVLGGGRIAEDVLHVVVQLRRPRREGGPAREVLLQPPVVEVRGGRQRHMEGTGGPDVLGEPAPGQHDDFVPAPHQVRGDGEDGLDMTVERCCGSDDECHGRLPELGGRCHGSVGTRCAEEVRRMSTGRPGGPSHPLGDEALRGSDDGLLGLTRLPAQYAAGLPVGRPSRVAEVGRDGSQFRGEASAGPHGDVRDAPCGDVRGCSAEARLDEGADLLHRDGGAVGEQEALADGVLRGHGQDVCRGDVADVDDREEQVREARHLAVEDPLDEVVGARDGLAPVP